MRRRLEHVLPLGAMQEGNGRAAVKTDREFAGLTLPAMDYAYAGHDRVGGGHVQGGGVGSIPAQQDHQPYAHKAAGQAGHGCLLPGRQVCGCSVHTVSSQKRARRV